MSSEALVRARSAVGYAAVALFVALYVVELNPWHDWPPWSLRILRANLGTGGVVALNVLVILAFLALLPYRRPTEHVWKARGVYAAFMIAVITEMFGLPLLLFLLSPLVGIPQIGLPYLETVGHWPITCGVVLSFAGLILVARGWARIHSADGLVTDGLYRYMRHPQYTGIALFTLGWLLHWPTVLTLILWPPLLVAYAWLARAEERDAIARFGQEYRDYASRTKRFVPFVL